MASTGTPTPYAGLNQWAEMDKPRMEDFNRDNLKVDEALAGLAESKVDFEIGSWTPAITGRTLAGDIRLTSKQATYIRIGKLCYVKFFVWGTTIVTPPEGNLELSGFPFPRYTGGGFDVISFARVRGFSIPNAISLSAYFDSPTSALFTAPLTAFASYGHLNATHINESESFSLVGSGSYIIA